MPTQSDTDKIIRQVYCDVENGFGSIAETHRESKKILNSITYSDVKDFFGTAKVKTNKRL
jgi:hypothetical protein